MLTSFQKFLSKIDFKKKVKIFIFPKNREEFEISKNNCIFQIPVPKNIKHHAQFKNFPKSLGVIKLTYSTIIATDNFLGPRVPCNIRKL